MRFQVLSRIFPLTFALCQSAWAAPEAAGNAPTTSVAALRDLFAMVGMHATLKLREHDVEVDAANMILAKAKECLDKVEELDASHKLLADAFVDGQRAQVNARVAMLFGRTDFVNAVERAMIEQLAARHSPAEVERAAEAWRTSADEAHFNLGLVLPDAPQVMGESMTQVEAPIADDLNKTLQELVFRAATTAGAAVH